MTRSSWCCLYYWLLLFECCVDWTLASTVFGGGSQLVRCRGCAFVEREPEPLKQVRRIAGVRADAGMQVRGSEPEHCFRGTIDGYNSGFTGQ